MDAQQSAEASGQRVEVVSRRTERDTTWANPDGSLTTEFRLSPVRVRQDGEWVPVDLALEQGAAGQWAPKAGPVGVSVSDRGSAPVLTVGEPGRELGLSWPSALPAAQVSGRVAEYDLGDGAVLQVTASGQGAWLRVVLSKQPARAPVWRLPLTMDGLDVAESEHGSFVFTDSSGQTVFSIAAPRMWDATRTPDGIPLNEEPVASRLVREGGQLLLELAPSAEFLADAATVYPVTVDPDVTDELWQVRDTWVQQGVTGGRGGDPKLLTGLVGGDIARSFIQYDSAPLNGATIKKAELNLFNWYSGSCVASPVFVRPVTEAWDNPTTVWTNQPSFSSNDAYLGTKSFAYGNSADGCPTDKWAAINVTAMVTEWTDEDGVMEVDHGMRVASLEGGEAKRHTFCSDNPGVSADAPCNKDANRPTLVVTYNKPPNVPTGQATDPPTPCVVGASAPSITTSSPTLKATVSDPDGGQVYGKFEVFKASDLTTAVATGTSAAVASGGPASWKVGQGTLVNGTKYAWRVRSYDLQRTSAFTGWCEFTVALPPPSLNPPTTIHATGAELSWPAYSNPIEPFTEYQIHRGTTAGFAPSDATRVTPLPTGTTSFTDTTATPTPADAPSETGSTVYYKLAVKTEGGALVSSAAQAVALPKAGRTTKIISASVTDTTLSQTQATANLDSLGGQPALEVGNNSPTYGTTRALVKFGSLSELPAGSRVMDADLGLWATGNTGSGAGFNAHALTRAFGETTATWNQANTGVPWTSAGGDFSALPANPTPVSITGTGTWVNVDVAGAVSGWLATPSSNHGLLVKTSAATPGQRVTFASSEAATAAQRPRLSVTYLTASTSSTYYAPHTPQLMAPNQDETVTVTVTNTTGTIWNSSDWILSYHWLRPDRTEHSVPPDTQPPGLLSQAVSPGESLDVTATIKPPVNSEKGRSAWVLAWELRNKTAGRWLSQDEPTIKPLEQDVAVQEPPDTKLGLEDFYQYVGQATGAGSSLLVNQNNGNAVFSYDAFSNPSRGVNTFLRMTYNSADRGASPLGYGWSLAASSVNRLGTPLDFKPTAMSTGKMARGENIDGFVDLVDGDGSTHTFTCHQATRTCDHPVGVHLHLQPPAAPATGNDPAGPWVMTAPDGTKFYFEASDSINHPETVVHRKTVDRNGNTLELRYEGRESQGRPSEFLTSIVDPSGRTTMTITYYTKGQSYTYIDDTGAKVQAANLTNPHIIDRVSSITDISGRKLSFTYTQHGLLGEMVDGTGDAQAKTFVFGYDPTQTNTNTKLISVRDPRLNTTRIAYHGPQPDPTWHWWAKSITDRATSPGVTEFVYADPNGPPLGPTDTVQSTVTDANGRATSYLTDPFGRPTEIINPKSQLTKLTWDGDHNVAKLEEPAAAAGGTTAKTQWAYDQKTGYPLVMIDPVANGATFDPNPLTSTRPRTTFGYQTSLDGHVADLTSKTSPLGFRWNFGYDPNGNLTSVTDPEGVATAAAGDFQTTYGYHGQATGEPAGLLHTATDANGNTTTYTDYDATGYPTRITDAADADTFVGYDARGNVTSVQDDNGKTSTYTYDLFGRPLETRVPKSLTETIITKAPIYDRNDNVEKAFAPYINTPPANLAEWTYVYDKLDQVDTATEPKDDTTDPTRTTDYGYDPVGNLTSVVEPNLVLPDARDFRTTYQYDLLDQLDTVTNAEGGRTEYVYDNAGNLITERDEKKAASADPNDFTTKYGYDLNHRVTSVTDADNQDPVSYGYDADGRTTSVTDETNAVTTYGYDRRDLLTKQTVPHDPTGPDFDTAVTDYAYDQVGNRTAVVSPQGAATSGPAGSPEERDFRTVFSYDALNRVDKRFFPCAPPAPCDPAAAGEENWPDYIDYDYDNVGNLTTVSAPPSADTPDQRAETTYTYSDNGWVTASTDPWEITTSYGYNAMGKQTSRTVTPAGEAAGSLTARSMIWTYTPDGKLATRSDEGAPNGRQVVLVDNSDKQNTKETAAEWDTATTQAKKYHGYNYATQPAGTGTNTFTWDLAVPEAGSYQVFARNAGGVDPGSATNATYTIHHNGTTTTSPPINQSTGTGSWNSLATVTFAAGTGGQKVVLTDAANGEVAADAVKLVRTPAGADNERKDYAYQYDPNGNLDLITDNSSGAAITSYDVDHTELNQLSSVVEKAGAATRKTTGFGYEPNGLLDTVSHEVTQAGAVDQYSAYDYETRNLLSQVRVGTTASDPTPKITNFGYDPRRLRTTMTKHNNNTVNYLYYRDSLLKDQHEKTAAGVDVARHQLTYTLNGHRDTDTTRLMNADNNNAFQDFVRNYDYDPRDRISSVTTTGSVASTETYTHDAADNLQTQVIDDAGVQTTTEFHHDRNRLLHATTSVGTSSTRADYNYDPYGRLDTVITGTGPTTGTVLESYRYDGFDRTTRHTKNPGTGAVTTDYTYDPLDRTASRTRQPGTPQAKTTHLAYLGLTDTVVSESTDALGATPTKTYQHTPDGELLSQTKHLPGGGVEDSYYGHNPHTDVETLTRPDGTTRATYGYTAYGSIDKDTTLGVDKPDPANPTKEPYNPYRYTAKRWDEATGNLDMGFRDYSPGLNRFLTLDSYNGAFDDQQLTTNPWTNNRYTLAAGNPITGIEIDGHEPRPFHDFDGTYTKRDRRAHAGQVAGYGAIHQAVLRQSDRQAIGQAQQRQAEASQAAAQAAQEAASQAASQAAQICNSPNPTDGFVNEKLCHTPDRWRQEGTQATVEVGSWLVGGPAIKIVGKAGGAAINAVGKRLTSRTAANAGPRYVYRGGADTPNNFTPRPGIDRTGLSTFDNSAAAAPKGGKVQVIDTGRLKCTTACPDAPPAGHVSIQPRDPSAIPGWAATRGTGNVSQYTQDILDAIVDVIRVPRP